MDMLNFMEFEVQVIESSKSQSDSQCCHPGIRYQTPMVLVYQLHCKMTKPIISVPKDGLNDRISVKEHLYGKYDKAILVHNDLSDFFQFPALKREVYAETITKEDGTKTTKAKVTFRGIQCSTLINLTIVPMFGMTLDTMQCTKLLIS